MHRTEDSLSLSDEDKIHEGGEDSIDSSIFSSYWYPAGAGSSPKRHRGDLAFTPARSSTNQIGDTTFRQFAKGCASIFGGTARQGETSVKRTDSSSGQSHQQVGSVTPTSDLLKTSKVSFPSLVCTPHNRGHHFASLYSRFTLPKVCLNLILPELNCH